MVKSVIREIQAGGAAKATAQRLKLQEGHGSEIQFPRFRALTVLASRGPGFQASCTLGSSSDSTRSGGSGPGVQRAAMPSGP